MKHKHADLIHAWANGSAVQMFDKSICEWKDKPNPTWYANDEYRIKPEEKKPVVRWLWACQVGEDKRVLLSTQFSTEQPDDSHGWIKLEWSRTEFPE